MGTPEIIRQHRIGLRLTQADLARAVGVDVRQINRYETGATEPTLAVARRIAEQLRITMDQLAGAPSPLTGTWWSAWQGLDADHPDRIVIGAVELTQQGHRVTIQPDPHAPDSPADTTDLIAWRAEMYTDPDTLLGWYTIDTPTLRARGTLNLAQRDNTIDGAWIKFTLTISQWTTGHMSMARTEPAARLRLQQILALRDEPD